MRCFGDGSATTVDQVEAGARKHRDDERCHERQHAECSVRTPCHVREPDRQRDTERAEMPCQMGFCSFGVSEDERCDVLSNEHDGNPCEGWPHPTAAPENRRAHAFGHCGDEIRDRFGRSQPNLAIEHAHLASDMSATRTGVEVGIEARPLRRSGFAVGGSREQLDRGVTAELLTERVVSHIHIEEVVVPRHSVPTLRE